MSVLNLVCTPIFLGLLIKSLFFIEEAQKTLEESMAMDIDDRQELAMEVYRGKRNGTLGRSHPAPVLAKSPPRPSPASVAYHSDDESLKAYDENPDDSSLTEKPSEISSTDSQVSTDSRIQVCQLFSYLQTLTRAKNT